MFSKISFLFIAVFCISACSSGTSENTPKTPKTPEMHTITGQTLSDTDISVGVNPPTLPSGLSPVSPE